MVILLCYCCFFEYTCILINRRARVYTMTAEHFTNNVLDSEHKRGIYNICLK